MSARMSSKQLRENAQLVLKDKKHAPLLQNILLLIQDYDCSDVQPCILTLEMIFGELLKRREVGKVFTTPEKTASCDTNYGVWLRQRYERTFTRLLIVLKKHSTASQLQALSTMMKLLALEGRYPLEDTQKGEFYFPVQRLQFIILALLSSEQNMTDPLNRFQEFTSYYDVLYFVWKMLPNIALSQKKPNEIFIKNFLLLIDKIPLPKEEELKDNAEMILCAPSGILDGPGFVLNLNHLRKWLNRTWGCVMHWDHTQATHHQLLYVLLEKVLHHLDYPLLLTDFLMDSLDSGHASLPLRSAFGTADPAAARLAASRTARGAVVAAWGGVAPASAEIGGEPAAPRRRGGAVGVLALQGIFTLIQKHNLEYPDLFVKLYSMFEPEIFHTKYKARLFYLSDMFLSSTHLPENLVAAFAKRLARLTLVAPPQDILVILMFIGNLILRHPGLKRLINHPTGGEVNGDPYIMDERDPVNSCAMESSLWEIQSLQNHILPSIATAARFINSPLPSVEWDLTKILEQTPDDIFVKELKKKAKEIALTFDKPISMEVPGGERLTHYWNF